MINHHPSDSLLTQYCAAQLPLSLSIALSAHIEMCSHCKMRERQREEMQAKKTWTDCESEEIDFGDMMHNIFQSSNKHITTKPKPRINIEVAGKEFTLPHAFRSFKAFSWSAFATINRARVISDEKNVRASLLHISEGGEIPTHQHKGYELTLLLDGSFSDEHGSYSKGDFILLDGDVKHSPKTEKGCLCYTVQDAPLHFTRGMSQVLNPLGKLIY